MLKNLAILTVFILPLITNPTLACFNVDTKSVKIKWTAYKTPAKAPVGGELKTFSLDAKKAKTISDVLTSSSIKIDGLSVNTKNPLRDKKIAEFFFSNAKDKGQMTAKIKSVNSKSKMMSMELMFNGVTKEVPMKFQLSNNSLTANGVIDVLDFSLSKSLKAINKACFALHEGKTWSDVAIELKAKFNSCK